MAYPVVFNAHGITGLPLPRAVTVHQGDLLDSMGRLADAAADGDGRISGPAAFIALATDATGAGATIPVATGGVLYDSDAPFTKRSLYLGHSGAITLTPDDPAQLVGFAATSPYYASINLPASAGIISSTDLADLVDLLFVLRENPADFASLGEMLEYLRAVRATAPI